jgi:multisubunit Na+/H+ antiporter MnhG subunit
MQPSILAHGLGAVILLLAVGTAVVFFKQVQKCDLFQIIILLLLFSSAVTIHGISHALLEKNYSYNPLKQIGV